MIVLILAYLFLYTKYFLIDYSHEKQNISHETHFECHDILMLGKSSIKWRQRPDMTIAVDWDVKHQFKQTNIFQLISLENEVSI